MDPRDDSLLQDLLDGRLGEAEAEAVRRRFETEPDLRETWDELQRIGSMLRASGGAPLPEGFLRSVRDRIAAESEAERTGEALAEDRSTTLPPGDPLATAVARPAARWRPRLLRAAVALAAVVVAVLGVGLLDPGGKDAGVSPDDLETAARGRDLRREEKALASRDAQEAARSRVAPSPSEAAGYAGESAAPEPEVVLRGPGGTGSVVGLDAPLGAPAAAAPVPGRVAFGPGDGVPRGLRRPSDEVEAGSPPPPSAPTPLAPPSAAEAWGDGVDGVLAFGATDLDEARARLALLVSALRSGGAGESLDRAPASEGAEAESKVADAPAVVLGSVLLTLSPGEAERLASLTRVLRAPGASDVRVRGGGGSGGGSAKGEGDAKPAEKPAGAPDEGPARLRVRVVFLRER